MAAGAPGEAGVLLRRAPGRATAAGDRAGVLRELAWADANAGRGDGLDWLTRRSALTTDPRERARIAQEVAGPTRRCSGGLKPWTRPAVRWMSLATAIRI